MLQQPPPDSDTELVSDVTGIALLPEGLPNPTPPKKVAEPLDTQAFLGIPSQTIEQQTRVSASTHDHKAQIEHRRAETELVSFTNVRNVRASTLWIWTVALAVFATIYLVALAYWLIMNFTGPENWAATHKEIKEFLTQIGTFVAGTVVGKVHSHIFDDKSSEGTKK